MKTFLVRSSTIFVLGATSLCAQSQADELRIALIKSERILAEANTAKVATAKLEQEFSKREKDLTAQDAAFKAQVDKFQVDAPTLSAAQQADKQRDLADQDRDLQRKRRAFEEDLNIKKNEQLQLVLASANEAVKKVAIEGKYDLVLQSAVYANPKLDITDKVLKLLNSPSGK